MRTLKTILICIALIALGITSRAQVPNGFNYMAIARNGSGDILPDEPLQVYIAILDGDLTIVYDEIHSVTTNGTGLFKIIVGQGAPVYGGYTYMFEDIDWKMQPLYIKTVITVDGTDVDLGHDQLFSVPYAMVSKTVIDNPVTMNNDTVVIMNSVDVVGNYATTEDEALFEVKRQDGQTMFAVYNQGVRINVPMVDNIKGVKGGFAIGGFGTSKTDYVQELFSLNKDSVRIYLDNSPDLDKGAKGGFAIGGFGLADKAGWPVQNYLFIAPDSARIYVKDTIDAKGVKGGFSIGGFGSSKGSATNFLDITQDNYFIGHETGINATVGNALYNSVIGFQAARALTTGDYNTILGYKADSSLTTGNNNIIIGATTGFKLTTGQHNTLIGSGAGFNHTSQQYNIMIGTGAGYNLTGSFNNFIGINAGNKIKPGTDNLFVGTNAGAMLEEGDGNTIVGIDAGRGGTWDPGVYHDDYITDNNTIIGNHAGGSLNVGSGNVFIGYNAGAAEIGTVGSPASNKLYIANSYGTALIYGNFLSGNVGLGTLSPAYRLDVAGDVNITGQFRVNGAPIVTTTLTTGDLTATGPVSISPTRQVVGGPAVISIANASTTGKGAVQLSNSFAGTSESLATTEKALKDGLATKVTGEGGSINIVEGGHILTLLEGDIVLDWDYGNDRILLSNKLGKDIGFWWKAQRDNVSEGLAGYIEAGQLEMPIITGGVNFDYAGFEIHFGPVDGSAGWSSVWLQYFYKRLVGHYLK